MDTPPKPLAHLYEQEITPEEQALWDAGNRLYAEELAEFERKVAEEMRPLSPGIDEIISGAPPSNPRHTSNFVLDRLPKSHPAYQAPDPSRSDPERIASAVRILNASASRVHARMDAERAEREGY